MRYASANYIAYNNANSVFMIANLYTLTLASGIIAYLTSYDQNISYGGNTFLSGADNGATALVKRGAVRYTRGTEVSTMDLTLFAGASASLSGSNICLAADNGLFDGCRVRWDRLKMQYPGDTSLGAVCMFEGDAAGVDPSSRQVVVHVKSDLEILQQQMPRILFQPGCANCFGDPACGVNRASYMSTGSAAGSPNASSVPTGLSKPDGYYKLGVLVMTSGATAGARRSISAYVANVATLAVPLPAAPAVGDTFQIYAACDRTRATCTTFNGNYQGFPYVPEASTSLGG